MHAKFTTFKIWEDKYWANSTTLISPRLHLGTGTLGTLIPLGLFGTQHALKAFGHSKHQALKGLGHWSTWGTWALYSANSCTILYAGHIILYNTTRKLHWSYPHTFVFICLSAAKANKRNEGRPTFLQPHSFIYLSSTWRQKICPWRVLRS